MATLIIKPIAEELVRIQRELKAPKSQRNSFGKYNYRSCEDIVEAVKPLLDKCALTLSDEMVEIGGRVYVKATATIFNVSRKDQEISAIGYAREPESKKGMDASQITGAASSYARKYALNGLFAIDDNKDADATNNHKEEPKKLYDEKQREQFEDRLMYLIKDSTGNEITEKTVKWVEGLTDIELRNHIEKLSKEQDE